MAKKFSELTAITTPAGADLLAVVDDTDSTSKGITLTNLLKAVADGSSFALADGQVLVGNGSGKAANVAVSGDATLANTGALSVTVVNGVTVADYDGTGRLDDEAHRRHNVGLKGHIGLQIHPGKQLLIRFKDLEVRVLE